MKLVSVIEKVQQVLLGKVPASRLDQSQERTFLGHLSARDDMRVQITVCGIRPARKLRPLGLG